MATVTNKALDETISEIADIMDWWYKNPDNQDIEKLNKVRNKLSALRVFLGESKHREQIKADLAYVNRKVAQAKITLDYKDKVDVTSFAQAERLADKDTELVEQLKTQKKLEGTFERLKDLVSSSDKVLTAMHQTLSLLSKEKHQN